MTNIDECEIQRRAKKGRGKGERSVGRYSINIFKKGLRCRAASHVGTVQ